jgi:CRP-like cAMP-binding protein
MGQALGDVRDRVQDLLIASARRHVVMSSGDELGLRQLPFAVKAVANDEDIVRQGDRPDVTVFIVSGTLARYHTMPNGERQYLSVHIAGDLPDVQSLFLKIMDHSVCSLGDSEIATFKHEAVTDLLTKRPNIASAFWRMTLVDAAIFRQAITNNSSRPPVARIAHFCCEQYSRARDAGLVDGNSCRLPLSQIQLGQTLGMSHISVNRALQVLRAERLLDLRHGVLTVNNWRGLVRRAGFDPTYLHAVMES